MSAQILVATARDWIGTRWRHRGRSRRGIDCVGLVYLAARASGIALEDASHYGRDPWDDRLRRELRSAFGEAVWRQEDPSDIEWMPGDVALVCWYSGEPSHVGVIADHKFGGLSLIHCENLNGCVEHSLSGHYIDCVTEVYRPWPVKSSRG
jgi:cell wall-associated NlpC family hydrolase